MNFVLTTEILCLVASYGSYQDIYLLSLLNKKSYIDLAADNEEFWYQLCLNQSIPSRSSTRTRGKVTWKKLYMSYLCGECSGIGRGTIVIDVNGGRESRSGGIDSPLTSLIPICLPCLQLVQSFTSYESRKKFCLLRLKRKRGDYCWLNVLQKIPMKKQKKGVGKGSSTIVRTIREKYSREYQIKQESNENNYLLRQVKKVKR